MSEFSEALDAYLKRHKKTQAALAKAVGVSFVTVWRWRTGRRKPSRMAAKILQEVGVQWKQN